MARNMYGATSADFTVTSGGRVVPGAELTIWSARTGGTQITDLLDVNSAACTTVTSGADGSVVYYGPNNDKTVHWADAGQGARVAIRPTDITGDPPVMSIGTVTTGTAAATLTGTSEAPVLNLTLPSAGANGVDTAALQDSAVTSAKIADGTITATDVAASTFAAFGTVGNLLTANQASGTDDTGTLGGGYSGCTFSSVTDYAYQGSRSIRATAAGAGEIKVGKVGVTPGQTYTVIGRQLRVSGAVTPFISGILWQDAASANLSTSELLPRPALTTAGQWYEWRLTATAPANAAYGIVYQYIDAAFDYRLDALSFHAGAGGVWSLPGYPVVGQSHIATNGAVHLSGTGTPEGVVTAAPGSTWLQTDSTTDVKGWLRWIKATGTGNTGWVAGPEADTGWRNVTATVDAAWESNASVGYLRLRRRGTTIFLTGRLGRVLNSGAFASWSTVYQTPTGFYPTNIYNIRGNVYAQGYHGMMGDTASGGQMQVICPGAAGNWATGNDLFFSVQWEDSSEAWPSSLPGSAV